LLKQEERQTKLAASKSHRSDAFYKEARVVSCSQIICKNGIARAIPFTMKGAATLNNEISKIQNSPGKDFSCYGISNLVGGGKIHNKNLEVERRLSLAQ
jgi:hypothetical protein